jgi:hypothetical protein
MTESPGAHCRRPQAILMGDGSCPARRQHRWPRPARAWAAPAAHPSPHLPRPCGGCRRCDTAGRGSGGDQTDLRLPVQYAAPGSRGSGPARTRARAPPRQCPLPARRCHIHHARRPAHSSKRSAAAPGTGATARAEGPPGSARASRAAAGSEREPVSLPQRGVYIPYSPPSTQSASTFADRGSKAISFRNRQAHQTKGFTAWRFHGQHGPEVRRRGGRSCVVQRSNGVVDSGARCSVGGEAPH